jgi:serine/threonine protein kinase
VPDANDNHGASVCEPNTTVSLRPSRPWLAAASQTSFVPESVTERSRVTEATRPRARGSTAGIDPNIGTVIGSYRLLSRIGQGGMSQVYVAEHTRLGRRVAVKVLRSDLARRPTAVTRFLREARIASRIRHVNIVQLEDLIEPDGSSPGLVMELLAGRSLRDILRSERALPPAQVLDIGVQVASALEAIHAKGVLHRDLTPGNIFVCDDRDVVDGWIKLLDFGAAKMFTAVSPRMGAVRDEHVTAEGTIIGTPGYMSPEQAGGTVIDARTDLYSLGVLLYELISGEPVVRGKTFDECVRAHITNTPRDLHLTERGKRAPLALCALIMRCLARDPAARPTSATQLRQELLALRSAGAPRSPSLAHALRIPLLVAAAAAMIAAVAHATPGSIRAGLGSTDNMFDVAGSLWAPPADAAAPVDAGAPDAPPTR